jgi:hypothetical protein
VPKVEVPLAVRDAVSARFTAVVFPSAKNRLLAACAPDSVITAEVLV